MAEMKKILVIDDVAEVRDFIAETLTIYGYEILLAEDGLAGVQMAQEKSPDLILCDVTMPGLDGHATLARLRQNPATAGIPFIFLTGVSDTMNLRLGLELGAGDFITKPFTMKELAAAVQARFTCPSK
jgi:CheY-like chemotaxis protein